MELSEIFFFCSLLFEVEFREICEFLGDFYGYKYRMFSWELSDISVGIIQESCSTIITLKHII